MYRNRVLSFQCYGPGNWYTDLKTYNADPLQADRNTIYHMCFGSLKRCANCQKPMCHQGPFKWDLLSCFCVTYWLGQNSPPSCRPKDKTRNAPTVSAIVPCWTRKATCTHENSSLQAFCGHPAVWRINRNGHQGLTDVEIHVLDFIHLSTTKTTHTHTHRLHTHTHPLPTKKWIHDREGDRYTHHRPTTIWNIYIISRSLTVIYHNVNYIYVYI